MTQGEIHRDTNPPFQTFVRGGAKYLAVPTERVSVHIIDEKGNNYGSWSDVASFDEYRKKHDSCVIGKARLEVRALIG